MTKTIVLGSGEEQIGITVAALPDSIGDRCTHEVVLSWHGLLLESSWHKSATEAQAKADEWEAKLRQPTENRG